MWAKTVSGERLRLAFYPFYSNWSGGLTVSNYQLALSNWTWKQANYWPRTTYFIGWCPSNLFYLFHTGMWSTYCKTFFPFIRMAHLLETLKSIYVGCITMGQHKLTSEERSYEIRNTVNGPSGSSTLIRLFETDWNRRLSKFDHQIPNRSWPHWSSLPHRIKRDAEMFQNKVD